MGNLKLNLNREINPTIESQYEIIHSSQLSDKSYGWGVAKETNESTQLQKKAIIFTLEKRK